MLKQEAESSNEVLETATDILSDVERLLHQEVALVRAEVRAGIGRLKISLLLIILSLGALLASSVLVPLSLVFLLYQAGISMLPLWSCFLIVAVFMGAIGVVLLRRSLSGLV